MRKGLSLPEVLVVCGLLSLLAAVVVAIYVVGLRAQTQVDASTTAYRQSMLALEHLRRELRGARLLEPAAGAEGVTARYQVPQLQNGLLLVDEFGVPVWAGEATLSLTAEGALLRTDAGGEARQLAVLGSQGSVVYRRLTPISLELEIAAYAQDPRAQGQSHLRFELTLSNQ